jgi:hypothetical protein
MLAIGFNIAIKQPERLEWSETTSRVFSEKKKFGKILQGFSV